MALTKVSRGLLSTGIVDNSNATAITIDSSENVGIGTVPSAWRTAYADKALDLGTHSALYDQFGGSTFLVNNFYRSNDNSFKYKTTAGATAISLDAGQIGFLTAPSGTAGATATLTQHMLIDSSGNLLVGKTATAFGTAGIEARSGGTLWATASETNAASFNRLSTDGAIAYFSKDGTTVGSIGTLSGTMYIGNGDCNLLFTGASDQMLPVGTNGATKDGQLDLGSAGNRFDDIFATNGTIQTSDLNEKQDIEELSDAEQRVAVAAKRLMRKFRWIDAVEAKGDDARIHFGIIAQDLQAAFEAEGLDAGRYAMFMSNTWWETQTEVAAVEATEDTEAVDAYTRTDTYDTAEEAPEGATERTRLGVRYSELLAFIIAAI